MEIPKRLVKVEVEGRRKLLDKEQDGYKKRTRVPGLWESDRPTGVTIEEFANGYVGYYRVVRITTTVNIH